MCVVVGVLDAITRGREQVGEELVVLLMSMARLGGAVAVGAWAYFSRVAGRRLSDTASTLGFACFLFWWVAPTLLSHDHATPCLALLEKPYHGTFWVHDKY